MAACFSAQALFSRGLHHGVPSFFYWLTIVALIGAASLGGWLGLRSGPASCSRRRPPGDRRGQARDHRWLIIALSHRGSVGIFTGWLVAKVGIPSFIVTLALFLAWQGVVLYILNSHPSTSAATRSGTTSRTATCRPAGGWIFIDRPARRLPRLHADGARLNAQRARAGGRHVAARPRACRGAGRLGGSSSYWFFNQNRNPNSGIKIEGVPWAASHPDRVDDRAGRSC